MAENSRFYVRTRKILLLMDVLCLSSFINPTSSCPSVCECGTQSGSKWIQCLDTNFTTLPNDIPLDTNLLFLSNTKITTFSANAFSRLSHLSKIELSNNRIENITDGVFNSLSKLRILNLPNNGIKRISSNAFAGLTSLTKLTLSINELTSLPENMLKDLTNLKTLSLGNNQLTTLPDGFLNSTRDLTTLHLNGNNFTKISNEMFQKQTKLTLLYLNKNQIQSIEDNAFKSAGATLLILNIESNRLPTVPRALNDVTRDLIIEIGLGNNLMTLIPQEAKKVFEQVKKSHGQISLSGNPLVCSKGLEWLQTWIKQNKLVIKDADRIMCTSLNGKRSKLVDYDFNSTVFHETTASTTATTANTTTTTTTTTSTTTTRKQTTQLPPSTHNSPRPTLKPLKSTSRVMSTTEAQTSATDFTTKMSRNVTSTQEMPASGSASSANITQNIFTKTTPKTDEADMTILERNKHIILATCLSAVFIGLVVFVAMYCFRSKIVKREKVLSTRYDRVRIV